MKEKINLSLSAFDADKLRQVRQELAHFGGVEVVPKQPFIKAGEEVVVFESQKIN
jgi:hypothetical protein